MSETAFIFQFRFVKNFLAAGCLLLAGISAAQADIVAQWTFETSQPSPTASGPFVAENGIYAVTSMASGSHTGATTYSSPAGAGSENSFSSIDWTSGDYYQFTTSTLGYSDVSVSFEAASSGTGPRDFQIAYSTDGTTFSVFTIYSVLGYNVSPNPTWSASMSDTNAAKYAFNFDLSTVTALDNQATVYFRLIDTNNTSANGGTVDSRGSSRVDDFTISASPATVAAVPEASTFFAGAFLVLPWLAQGWRRARRLPRRS